MLRTCSNTMQFSDTSTAKAGLIQEIEQTLFTQYGTITDDTTKLSDFTNRLNRAYDKIATIIMASDKRWQWDDRNYTTELPIGTTDITDGQKDYVMDLEHLRIIKVQVTDSAGNKKSLVPIDIQTPEGKLMYDEGATATEGTPVMYDKFSNIIRVYPTPNYDYTNGLIVHYQRQPSYFVTTDTTKKPGVPVIFHSYLSKWAAMDYAIDKQLTVKNDLFNLVEQKQREIEEWYNQRDADMQMFFRAKQRSIR